MTETDPTGGHADPDTTQAAEADNITEADLIGGVLLGGEEQPETPEPETEEPEAEPETETPEEEPEPEPEETNGSEGIDVDSILDGLNPDEIEALGKRLGSNAVARFGELTRKRREAEEALQAATKPSEKLEATPKNRGENQFKHLDSLQAVQEEFTKLTEAVEWAEAVLDENEDSLADDVVASAGGKDYTKKQVRAIARNARKAKENDLPQRFDELRAVERGLQLRTQFDAKAKEAIPELDDKESEVGKLYDAIMADERAVDALELIRERQPEIHAQWGWLMAHAARSITQNAKPKVTGKPKPKAPENPTPNAAPSGNHATRDSKKVSAARQAFESSGSVDDLTRFLTARAG